MARNEARTIAVSFLDHNTVRDLLKADQPSLSAATLDADVRTLLRWNNRYEMVLEGVEERGREVDGEGWINRFEQRMTRAVSLEYEELDARYRNGEPVLDYAED